MDIPSDPELSTWLEIKHGEVGFYLTQVLPGHDDFSTYLKRFKKKDEETCHYCGSPVDDTEHLSSTLSKRICYWYIHGEKFNRTVALAVGKPFLFGLVQCSQNVDVNGPHHRCFELIVSSSFNQPIAVERGRSHGLVGSMVGAVYVHVLRTLV